MPRKNLHCYLFCNSTHNTLSWNHFIEDHTTKQYLSEGTKNNQRCNNHNPLWKGHAVSRYIPGMILLLFFPVVNCKFLTNICFQNRLLMYIVRILLQAVFSSFERQRPRIHTYLKVWPAVYGTYILNNFNQYNCYSFIYHLQHRMTHAFIGHTNIPFPAQHVSIHTHTYCYAHMYIYKVTSPLRFVGWREFNPRHSPLGECSSMVVFPS